ncbi:hypothetical protein LG299_03920 [Microbacterium lacus]|uniref:hypothetical protein n=1 Tax=Microbacterium lacus TaxID=415217 RepID=UPI003850DD91
MTSSAGPTRRIELTMRRPWFALYFGVRPTLVISGRGQPTQWGRGTWQVAADTPAEISVFLFNRLWKFGQATIRLKPDDPPVLEYRAPALPFRTGRFRGGVS